MKSLTGVTKSPEDSLTPEERKHQLWRAVERSETEEEEREKLEAWCVGLGESERLKRDGEVGTVFDLCVEREMALRQTAQ